MFHVQPAAVILKLVIISVLAYIAKLQRFSMPILKLSRAIIVSLGLKPIVLPVLLIPKD